MDAHDFVPMPQAQPCARRRIRLFAMDIDGTLTDGAVEVRDEAPSMRMCVQDGLGIERVREAGVVVAWISGRASESVRARAGQLGVTEVWLGETDKLARLMEIADRLGVAAAEIAYMGDDLPDLPAMRFCGVSIAPPNAIPEVRREADWVTRNKAGSGAVREACEMLVGSAVSRKRSMPV